MKKRRSVESRIAAWRSAVDKSGLGRRGLVDGYTGMVAAAGMEAADGRFGLEGGGLAGRSRKLNKGE